MVLSIPSRPGSGRHYVPGKVAWSMLAGVVALATFLTFNAAAWSNGAVGRTPLLKSEIDHAGA